MTTGATGTATGIMTTGATGAQRWPANPPISVGPHDDIWSDSGSTGSTGATGTSEAATASHARASGGAHKA
jgi:hypothetical protein